MITKLEFDDQIEWFEAEFDNRLTKTRRDLFYQNVYYLSSNDLNTTLITIVERFNKDDLPTVRTMATIAYHCCTTDDKPGREHLDCIPTPVRNVSNIV